MAVLPWDRPLEDEPGFRQALTAVAKPDSPDSAWEFLWEHLIHQYDIDEKGIKAVPLLVQMASQLSRELRYEHLALVGSIAYCSELPGSRWVVELAPKALQRSFVSSLDQAATLVAESLVEQWDVCQMKDLLLAYAACRGHARLADHLERYEVLVTCPKCDHHFELPSSVNG
jgi:hypothetical protein